MTARRCEWAGRSHRCSGAEFWQSSASAAFLVNHGIVTVGPTLQVATVAAILLERAVHQQWTAHGFGSWPTWSDPAESRSKREHIFHPQALDQVWHYLVRRLEA